MTLKKVFVFSIRFVPYLLKLIALLSALSSHLIGSYPNYHYLKFLIFKSTGSELSSQLSKSNFPCQLSLSSLPAASHQTLVLHLVQFKTRFGAISKQHVIFRPSYGLVGREDIHWRRSCVIDACPTAIPAIQNLR